jgi:hypothetical protein
VEEDVDLLFLGLCHRGIGMRWKQFLAKECVQRGVDASLKHSHTVNKNKKYDFISNFHIEITYSICCHLQNFCPISSFSVPNLTINPSFVICIRVHDWHELGPQLSSFRNYI